MAAQFTDSVQHCHWRFFGAIVEVARSIAMRVPRRPEKAVSRSTARGVAEAGAGVQFARLLVDGVYANHIGA